MKVLIVTNGHGEDQLAVCLIDGLREEWPELGIEAIPLVGRGDRLAAAGVAVEGPRVLLPSGGMVRPEPGTVWRDLRAGLVRKFFRQRRFVASRRDQVQAVIAVGDVLAGWTAGGALPDLPLVLVATAKSEHISGHGAAETRWMRRRARRVFARDETTAAALRKAGVDAVWEGNLMMDAFTVSGVELPVATAPLGPTASLVPAGPAAPVRIGLFPGSRDDAYVNLRHLARILLHMGRPCVGLVPLAPGLDPSRSVAMLRADGWSPPGSASSGPFGPLLEHSGVGLALVQNAFGDVLIASEVVVGLAGTANEQAAGLGKPVVVFPGPGVQFGARFLRAQKRLLGDAVAVAEPRPAAVAATVRRILEDPELHARMAAAGRERMGPPGASRRMARSIAALWRPD